MVLQRLAAGIDRDQFLERHIAALEAAHDLLELGERFFEGESRCRGREEASRASSCPAYGGRGRRWQGCRATSGGAWGRRRGAGGEELLVCEADADERQPQTDEGERARHPFRFERSIRKTLITAATM